ncbi:hypothetical protein Dsin_011186 [Dipteronia sinensis]|uniref:MIP18 family-like domain-containing protein n=1 Tax=Dipteronia sinensis TaxID=43782 RepID=A0AAE0ATT3_9ROSI|nr:hypothetical protein Dsin_011186 [Dipteronia sinensis]
MPLILSKYMISFSNFICFFLFCLIDEMDNFDQNRVLILGFEFDDDDDFEKRNGRILITFTPTIQHCGMATVIGLCLRVKLKQFFPPHFMLDIRVSPGSHANEESVNKQLNDKERVAAALENPNLHQLVDECLYSNEL